MAQLVPVPQGSCIPTRHALDLKSSKKSAPCNWCMCDSANFHSVQMRGEKVLYLRQLLHYNSVTIIWTPADPNWNNKGLSNQFSLQRSSFLLNQLLVQTRIPELVFFPKPLLSYSPTLILRCFTFSVPSPFLQALNPHTIHLSFLYILISLRIVLVR